MISSLYGLSLESTAMASIRFICLSSSARCLTVHSGCLQVTPSSTAFRGLLLSFIEYVQVTQFAEKEQKDAKCFVFFMPWVSGSNKMTSSSSTSRLSNTLCSGAARMLGPKQKKNALNQYLAFLQLQFKPFQPLIEILKIILITGTTHSEYLPVGCFLEQQGQV